MRLTSDRLRRLRGAADDGFTMILVICALALVSLLSVAAFAAVNDDLPLSANDSLQKQAYAAAQAGIQQYLFDLDQNSQFWTQCVPNPANGINYAGSISSTRPVPGSSTESYAIELMPAAGQSQFTQCSKSDPVDSMIQATGTGAGTLRIRSTGYAGNVTRTVVASLRQQSFLDYVWFTNFETSDPIVQAENAGVSPTSSNWSTVVGDAETQCGMYRFNGRYNKDFYNNTSCDQINFITKDNVAGPFHTNDQAEVCGTPTFGRSLVDAVEFGAPPGFYEGQGCSGSPNFKGNKNLSAANLKLPPWNSALQSVATSPFNLTGTTCITLAAGSISIAQPNATYPSCFSSGIPYTTYSYYPSNGVLYVANSKTTPCSLTYDPDNPSYTGNTGCGTVYIQGTYGSPLTINAENDIVIDGNLTHSGATSVLGLVANNFVRVYHPVGNEPSSSASCSKSSANAAGTMTNVSIDAMILSLQHSFIVDNYDCGGALGTLTVNGGIAQNFRGTVGSGSGGGVSTGYAKSYNYDDRLRYEEPPHFIDPTQSAWRVARENECPGPASSC